MIDPLDIAEAAHKVCVEQLMPKGISPQHDISLHTDTSRWYAEAINLAGLNVTGKEVVDAILKVTDWDMNSKWPGHPGPQKVIDYFRSQPT